MLFLPQIKKIIICILKEEIKKIRKHFDQPVDGVRNVSTH